MTQFTLHDWRNKGRWSVKTRAEHIVIEKFDSSTQSQKERMKERKEKKIKNKDPFPNDLFKKIENKKSRTVNNETQN